MAQPRVVQTMSGLAHHEWTTAITGTAAAIALESAQSRCATTFIAEVSNYSTPDWAGQCYSVGPHQITIASINVVLAIRERDLLQVPHFFMGTLQPL